MIRKMWKLRFSSSIGEHSEPPLSPLPWWGTTNCCNIESSCVPTRKKTTQMYFSTFKGRHGKRYSQALSLSVLRVHYPAEALSSVAVAHRKLRVRMRLQVEFRLSERVAGPMNWFATAGRSSLGNSAQPNTFAASHIQTIVSIIPAPCTSTKRKSSPTNDA